VTTTRIAVRSRRAERRAGGGDDLRRVVPIVAAGALAGVASLVTTVVVARLLSSRGYGAFIVLLGLFLVLSMPGSALLVAVVRRITAWESEGREERVHRWVVRVHVVGTVAVVLLALVIWLARGPLISALSLPGSGAVVAIVSAAGIWVLVSIDRGLLQARRRYRDLSVNLVVEALARSAATVGLAAVWGVTGAALGVLLGELATAVHARVTALAALSGRPAPAGTMSADTAETGPVAAAATDGRGGTAHSARDLAADLVTALVSLFMLAVLQNADVIGLGSAAPRRSGSYAAISVPSKALVYAALVFVNYLLPESAIRWHRGSHALRQLGHTLLVLGLPALVLLGVATGAPHTLLEVVFGAKLTGAAPAFATLVLAMVFLCLTVVLTVYLLGVGWRPVVLLLTVGSGALILATLAAHGRFVATARADLIVQAALALSLGMALVVVHKRAGRGPDRDTVGPAADQGDSH
jgi:O-antigen/teichoic acid export membrane protein